MSFVYDKLVNAEYPYLQDIPPGVANTRELAELAAESYRRCAAEDAPQRRLPGLLRWADGGTSGFGDDELSLDAHRRAHHLRGEDDP
jgi:hypothetical protein